MTSFFDSIARVFKPGSRRGDHPRRVRRLVDRGDHRKAGALLLELDRAEEALQVFAQGEAYDLAADCAEGLGAFEQAAEYYEKAGNLSSAAQMCVRSGERVRAAQLYGRMGEFVLAAETMQSSEEAAAPELASVWANAVTDMVPNEGETIRSTELMALRKYALYAAEAYAASRDEPKAVHFYEIAGYQSIADLLREKLSFKAMQQLDVARERIVARLQCLETGDFSASPPIVPSASSPVSVEASAPLLSQSFFDAQDLEQAVIDAAHGLPPEFEGDVEGDRELLDLVSWEWPALQSKKRHGKGTSAPMEDSRYKIIEKLRWRGVESAVRGIDNKSQAEFVMLLLPAEVIADEAGTRNFESVSRSIRTLRHDNLVAVVGHGVVARRPCIVTESVSGQTLEDLLEADSESRLPLSDAMAIIRAVLEGLSHAHEMGLVHGAVGTASVFCPSPTNAKLGNFGLAHLVSRELLAELVPTLAPEQLAGREPDARSDLFGVGCMLERVLARTSLSDLPAPTVSAGFERVVSTMRRTVFGLVQACMATDPAARPDSTAPLLEQICALQLDMAGAGPRTVEADSA